MTAIAIAGATGLVGSRVLDALLPIEEAHQILAVGRRPPSQQHPKLRMIDTDFASGADLGARMPGAIDAAVCALGTTRRRAGSHAAFRAVDHDAVLVFAHAALARGATRFVFVSSLGANPASRSFYLRVKGETESGLGRLPFARLHLVRPAMIDDQGARAEFRLTERLLLPPLKAVFAVLGRRRRYAPISADQLARAILALTLGEGPDGPHVVENEVLQTLGDRTDL